MFQKPDHGSSLIRHLTCPAPTPNPKSLYFPCCRKFRGCEASHCPGHYTVAPRATRMLKRQESFEQQCSGLQPAKGNVRRNKNICVTHSQNRILQMKATCHYAVMSASHQCRTWPEPRNRTAPYLPRSRPVTTISSDL